MGQAEANSVFQTLIASHQRKMQASQLAAQQVQAQSEQDWREGQLKIEQQRANDEHSQHQALLDLTKKARTLQNYEEQENLRQKWATTGQTPAGATWTQGSPQAGGTIQLPTAFNDDSGKPTTMQLNPIMQDAQNAAAIQSVMNKPKQDMIDEENAAKAHAARDLQADRLAEVAKQAQDRNDMLRGVNASTNATRLAMNALTNQTRANANAPPPAIPGLGGEPAPDPVATFQDHVLGLISGKYTVEQLHKDFYAGTKNQPAFSQLLQAAQKIGVPLHDKDMLAIKAIQQHVRNVGDVDSAIDQMPNTSSYWPSVADGEMGSYAHAPFLAQNTQFNSATAKLKGNLPPTSALMGGFKRLNDQDIRLVGGSYIPTSATPKSVAIMNRDNMLNTLGKINDDIVPGATDAQKAMLRQTTGVAGLKDWNSVQSDKRTNTNVVNILKSDPAFQQAAPAAQTITLPATSVPQQGVPQQ